MTELTPAERLFDDGFEGSIDPFSVFEDWFSSARDSEPNDPNAMALATLDDDGVPDVRMVLLNGRDSRGFVFFTNLESAKANQLAAHPTAALLFHWKSLRRQVRVRGRVEAVTEAEAEAYFATRHRTSQLGAHASRQSQPLAARSDLIAAVEQLDREYAHGPVPRPSHWSGFRLIPTIVEFWKDGAFRLHDRVQFTRVHAGSPWSRRRLYP